MPNEGPSHDHQGHDAKRHKPQPPQQALQGLEGAREASVDPAVAFQRATCAPPPAVSPNDILSLQRTVGNEAVGRILAERNGAAPSGGPLLKPFLQAKLTVNPPGDTYEREADRMAGKVMGRISATRTESAQRQEEEELQMMPADLVGRQEEEEEQLQTKPVNATQRQEEEEEELQMMPADFIGRQAEEEEEEEIQMRPAAAIRRSGAGSVPEVDGETEGRIDAARGSGESLDQGTREPMERAFGADFSGVRVHTDGQANELSQSLQARAFTTGQDIFFRSGEYNPASSSGQQLLAHELTHTAQQRAWGRIARENDGPSGEGDKGGAEKAKQGKPEKPVALSKEDKEKIKKAIPRAVARLKSEAELEKELRVREDSEERLKGVVEAAEHLGKVKEAQLQDPRVSGYAKAAAKVELGLPEPDESDGFFFEFGEEGEGPEAPAPVQAAAPPPAPPRRLGLPKPQTEGPSIAAEVGEAVVAGAEYGAEIGQGVGMAEVGAEAFGRTATGYALNVLSHVLGAIGTFFNALFGFLDIRAIWRSKKRIDALKEARELARQELGLAGVADADANELVQAIDYAIEQKYKKIKRRLWGLAATLLTGSTGIAFWAAGGISTVFAAATPVGWVVAAVLLAAGIAIGLSLLGYRIARAIMKKRARGRARIGYGRTMLDHALGEGSARQFPRLRGVAWSAIDNLKIRKERGFKGWIKGLFRKGPLLTAHDMIREVNIAHTDQHKEAVKDRCAGLIASKLRSG